ncbi:MAG: hypothetical protein ABIQ91_00030 [Candidatus Paceibacterota bacterium]
MAGRTGMQAFTTICKKACKLLAVWQNSIIGVVNASALSAEDKALAISTINSINASCDVFVQLSTRWEQ